MKRTCRKTVTTLYLMLFPLLASAQQLGFMRDSIWADMTDEEIASFKTVIRNALEEAPDRQVIEWSSPESELKGKIRSRFSYESAGSVCRRMVFQVSDQERRQNSHFDLCRAGEQWEVMTPKTRFSEAERKEIGGFIATVMEQQETGLPLSWSAENSASRIVIVPTDEAVGGHASCRHAAINISGEPEENWSGHYRFCRTKDGEWRYKPE